MVRGWMWATSLSILVIPATGLQAQASSTEELAKAWRKARLADLQAERARIDAQIAALPATPPMDAAPVPTPALKPPAPVVPADDVAAIPAEASATALEGRQTFGGLDLGVGLSFTVDLGKIDRISRASLVNSVVRSDDQDNGRARIMLESHYFFTPCTWNFLGLKNPCTNKDDYLIADPKLARWGLGPFIAVQPGSDNIIDAIGLGIMVGARREQSTQSFNLGVGVVFDPNTRVLGDGIRENQPLPNGETEVRYRETLQTGVLVLTSFSF